MPKNKPYTKVEAPVKNKPAVAGKGKPKKKK